VHAGLPLGEVVVGTADPEIELGLAEPDQLPPHGQDCHDRTEELILQPWHLGAREAVDGLGPGRPNER
jgi:hypothetical protein